MQAAQSLEARTVFIAPANQADVRDFAEDEPDVRAILDKVGPVLQMRQQYDSALKRFGFLVEFSSVKSAALALELDGIILKGRSLGFFSNVHRKGESLFGEDAVLSADAATSVATMERSETLPRNHEVPEDLRLMPLLIAELPGLGAYHPPPPPADAPPADKEANGGGDGDDGEVPAPPRDTTTPGEEVWKNLAAAQEEYVSLREQLEAMRTEIAEKRRWHETTRKELSRIAQAATLSSASIVNSVWGPNEWRIDRSVVAIGCPCRTSTVGSVISAFAKHGAVRLFTALDSRKGPLGSVDVVVEYCDDGVAETVLMPAPGEEVAMLAYDAASSLPIEPAGHGALRVSIAPTPPPRSYDAIMKAAVACLTMKV
jgi:hypothetical protein